MAARRATAALLAGLAIACAGCGGDDEEERPSGETTPVATSEDSRTATEPERTQAETAPPAETEKQERAPETTPREDEPGGAGDEIPASTQALLTGEGGRITPPLVRVPPFIAIRAELRSADGREYILSAGGRRLRAGGGATPKAITFDGLRPGRRLVLRGPQGRVVIEASAEPGP